SMIVFFFQAEDGIRDGHVTGVQTCALPILLYARLFALRVQDRVIRLEERLRYERILPEELGWRADELTVDQFISMRFAGDEELEQLMRKVLDDKLTKRKAIKQLIKNWRADYLRA